MDRTESTLKALTLQTPPRELRERVLDSVVEQPSEWKRLWHTLEWSTAVLVVLMAWSTWFEQGSEEMRRGLRTVDYAVHQAEVTRSVEALLSDEGDRVITQFVVARHMQAYLRPYKAPAPS
ncbi:MAG: hypothetical protein L3K26_06970 [Candidatus Hydrogenedentes bacterium]|nr:hypothetical protein [Candidatus Hydrogenedentota bacterium]